MTQQCLFVIWLDKYQNTFDTFQVQHTCDGANCFLG